MLSVIMLNVVMLNVASNPLMLSVIMLNVVMLSVVASLKGVSICKVFSQKVFLTDIETDGCKYKNAFSLVYLYFNVDFLTIYLQQL